MNYWLGVHTPEVCDDPKGHKSRIGWPAETKKTVAGIEPGDRVIMYVTRLQRFHAAYEVTGRPFHDPNYRLAGQPFPECVPVIELMGDQRPEIGVAVSAIRNNLEIFKNLRNPKRWASVVRRSIRRLDDSDGEAILQALDTAHWNFYHFGRV